MIKLGRKTMWSTEAEPQEPTRPSPVLETRQPRSRRLFSLPRLVMLSTPALAAVVAAAASALVVAAFAPDASAEVVTPPLATSPGQTLDMCKASAPKAGATIE